MKHISIFIAGSIGVFLVFIYFLKAEDRTVVNFFTVYGSYLSIFGLFIAYLQLVKLKHSTEQTKISVEENSRRINQILSVSDLSKSTKTIQEIQNYISIKKFDLAVLRMKDLRSALIAVQYSQEIVNSHPHSETYSRHITNLGIDIVNLSDLINGYKNGPNFSKINQNLDHLETFIGNFENEIKYKRHDTGQLQ